MASLSQRREHSISSVFSKFASEFYSSVAGHGSSVMTSSEREAGASRGCTSLFSILFRQRSNQWRAAAAATDPGGSRRHRWSRLPGHDDIGRGAKRRDAARCRRRGTALPLARKHTSPPTAGPHGPCGQRSHIAAARPPAVRVFPRRAGPP